MDMTTSHDFELLFRVPEGAPDGESHLDALFEAGCDDATVSVGRPGYVHLDFTRKAETLDAAVASAEADVLRAIPGCVRLASRDMPCEARPPHRRA